MTQNKRFTKAEEIANAISHGVGTAFSILALIIMVVFAARHGTGRHIVSISIFGASMIILYLSSTLNHALRQGLAKDFFHNFDQIAIYLLIAGTYTPLALIALHGDWGWTMFGIQWGLAIAGITLKFIFPNKFEKGVNIFFIISYILMGWMLLFFLFPLFRNLSGLAMTFIFLGGAFYTLGTIFFKLKKLAFSHLVWHLFVIAGTVSHFVAIYKFVLPLK